MPRRTLTTLVFSAVLLLAVVIPFGVQGSWAADGDRQADMAWSGSTEGLTVRGLSCLRIHPKDPGTLFAHVHGLGPARSTDEGKTWEPILAGTSTKPGYMDPGRTRISLDPRDPKIMYLSLNGVLFRSSDGGTQFKKMRAGALVTPTWDKLGTARLVWEVRVDDKKSALLLAGTRSDGRHHGGLFESQDGGQNWALIAGSTLPDTGLSHDAFWIRRDPKTEKNLTVAGKIGVWYSSDRGRSFSLNLPGIRGVRTIDVRGLSEFVSRDLYLADARGVWHSKDGGKSWGKKPLRAGDAVFVGADPQSRKRIFAIFADSGAFAQAARKGKWIPMGGPYGKSEIQSYAEAELRELVHHPRDKHTIYGASPVTGMHISPDHGKTFKPVPVVSADDAKADKDAKDAKKKEEKWVWPEVTASIAAVGVHTGGGKSTHMALSEEGVAYLSDDGSTWARVGRLGMAPRGLAAEPTLPQTWYAWGRSFMRTSDDGATWETLWDNPDGDDYVADFKLCPEGVIHLLLGRSGNILRYGAFGPKDAMAWDSTPNTARALKLGAAVATSFAIDPDNAQHIVFCTRSVNDRWVPKDGAGGVFETWDGGKKWKVLSDGLRTKDALQDAYWNHGRFVAFDAKSRLLLYGADWYGVRARQYVPADADPKTRKDAWPQWVDITPPESLTSLKASSISAFAGHAANGSASYVMQLRADNNATALVGVDSATLGAMWGAAHAAATGAKKDPKKTGDDEAPPSWSLLKDPGMVLTSLTLDASTPGRMVAADAFGQSGIQVFQAPAAKKETGSAPADDNAKKDEPKKDEAKKDEPKKDEPKGDAPKSNDATKPDPGKDDGAKKDDAAKQAEPEKADANK